MCSRVRGCQAGGRAGGARGQRGARGTCCGGTEAREQHAPVAACLPAPSSCAGSCFSSCFYARRGICGMTDVAAEPRPSVSWLLSGRPKNGFPAEERSARVRARVRAVFKALFRPQRGWRGCLGPRRWASCPGLPAAFGSARRNAGRAIASGSPEKRYADVRTRAASLQYSQMLPEFIGRILPLGPRLPALGVHRATS